MRNPYAKALRHLKQRIVRPKKGKGAYRRRAPRAAHKCTDEG